MGVPNGLSNFQVPETIYCHLALSFLLSKLTYQKKSCILSLCRNLSLLLHNSFFKSTGLYVLSSEPVKIPWFDSVFADIGDEQSLSQSLSTFSGHLKQTSVC